MKNDQIRVAQVEDAAVIAAVHVAAWQAGYRDLLPSALLDTLSVERRQRGWQHMIGTHRERVLIYVPEGNVRGFVSYGPSRDTDLAGSGEIYALYLHPEVWRTGAGGMLMRAACAELPASVALWVLAGNQRAIGFYQHMGFSPDGSTKIEHMDGVPLHEERYRRTG